MTYEVYLLMKIDVEADAVAEALDTANQFLKDGVPPLGVDCSIVKATGGPYKGFIGLVNEATGDIVEPLPIEAPEQMK